VFRAQENLNGLLITLVDDLNFNLVLNSEDAVKRSSKLINGLVEKQIDELRNALEIAAQAHLATSLISEAARAKEPVALVPIEDRFKATSDRLGRVSAALNNPEVKKSVDELLAVWGGRR
jgi:hypothetical protein